MSVDKNPYSNLPGCAFWKTGVAQENPFCIKEVYNKKFSITNKTKIAAAGSCFAQHVSKHLLKNGYNVLNVEPPPPDLPEQLHHKYGYSMYSGRYGNIYTVRQLLQLAQEVAGDFVPQNIVWENNGKFFDALRPTIEPLGLDSAKEVLKHREFHIARVKELFQELDLFIFTLGLTEMWLHRQSGTVYPTAPGAIIGEYDENIYEFKNAQFGSIISDFNKFQDVLSTIRSSRPFNILLTVSPVPLTATASGKHVLLATSYSKSTLRSVAGQLACNQHHIDYFPSYEIVTNPRNHSVSFSDNLRTVRSETVEMVMSHFLDVHGRFSVSSTIPAFVNSRNLSFDDTKVQCEESLLEAFGGKQ